MESLAAGLRDSNAGADRIESARQKLLQLGAGDRFWRLEAASILLDAGLQHHARQVVRDFVLQMERPDAVLREQRGLLARLCLRLGDHAPLERYVRGCYGAEIAIELGGCDDANRGLVHWSLADGRSIFTFAADIASYRYLHIVAHNWTAELPLLLAYAAANPDQSGSVWLNLEDLGVRPGLTFSDYRSDFFLLPDPIFMMTDAYRDGRRMLDEAAPPWCDRRPIAYWRGSSTGWLGSWASTWRELPRAVLCQVAQSGPCRDALDVGISQIVQFDESAAHELRQSGFIKDRDPLTRLMEYRFQIDVDGNTNAWMSLYYKLYSGSPVLKVQSHANFRQWYYDRLKPWWNFIPLQADMSDLHSVLAWLLLHENAAREIGARGRALATGMTIEAEIAAACSTIAAAFVAADYGRRG